MAIFAKGGMLVKTCQMYFFTVMKCHAHSSRVKLEDCYNCNSQMIIQLQIMSQNSIQVEYGKLQSK